MFAMQLGVSCVCSTAYRQMSWMASHTFESLMPIECKSLPTPEGKDRDEREYVFSAQSSSGGIQRFKAGHHGSKHNLGVAYVQRETRGFWKTRIADWGSPSGRTHSPSASAFRFAQLTHQLGTFSSSQSISAEAQHPTAHMLWHGVNAIATTLVTHRPFPYQSNRLGPSRSAPH